MPNLEKPECGEAREAVKQFYSFHFDNGMKPLPENLKPREKFLTGELKQNLSGRNETEADYFTQTSDYPKAFRIGKCETAAPNKTVFEILLFWKDDARSEQREIKVEAVKENNNWLINRVENK